MSRSSLLLLACVATCGLVSGQQEENFDFTGPEFNFVCPEKNGLFADEEQCDLYYVCIDNVATATLCKDGFLFDDTVRNHEKCVLPHGVNCGKREFVQVSQPPLPDNTPHYSGCVIDEHTTNIQS